MDMISTQTRRQHAIGISIALAAGIMLLLSSCLGLVYEWTLDSPFWPGLDRPPAYDQKLASIDAKASVMAGLWAVDFALYVCLLIAGMALAGAHRAAIAIIIGWCIAKTGTSIIRALLTHSVMLDQIAGMPDPLMPQYTTAGVRFNTYIGIVVLLAMRLFIVIIIGGLALFPKGKPTRQAAAAGLDT